MNSGKNRFACGIVRVFAATGAHFVPGKGFIEEQWTSLGAALKSAPASPINIFLYPFLLLSSIVFVFERIQTDDHCPSKGDGL